MISVQEAKDLIIKYTPTPQPENIRSFDAIGRVLAEDIFCPIDLPPFDQSSMDGYAFRHEDLEVGTVFDVRYEISAGMNISQPLSTNEAARIFTGAKLPSDADTVIMQEKVTKEDNKISIIQRQIAKGENVRSKGYEISASLKAIEKNTVLNAPAIGLLASMGIEYISVFTIPKVALIITGNEIQPVGTTLIDGKVYDSNSFMLNAALKSIGVNDLSIHYVIDDLPKLMHILENTSKEHDIVIMTGGVSVGDYDLVAKACADLGVQTIFHKIKQKPGKPMFFGINGKVPILGLPGNPASALTCFYEYVKPLILGLIGKPTGDHSVKAEIQNDYSKPIGISHFLKSHYADGKVYLLGAQESYRLTSYAIANALLFLPEESASVSKGDIVEVHIIS